MKLSDRFGALEETRAPDLWPGIERREPRPAPPVAPRGRRAATAIVALVVAAGAIVLAARAFIGMEAREPGATASVQPKENGSIWFRVGGGDGPSFVYEVQPDGSGQRLVFDSQPPRFSQIAWSPNGDRIAFVDPVVGSRGIYVSNPDGSDAQRLTEGVNDGWPSWSPDGTRIVFSSTRYDPSIETCEPGADFHCPTDLYVMNTHGLDITRLTSDPAPEYQPVWSPEGGHIAFLDAGNREMAPGEFAMAPRVFTIGIDGADPQPVSSGKGGSDFSPSWSPDSGQLVFAAIWNEDWGIWVVNADGTDEHAIVGPGRYVDDPVWSPDGKLIAFVGNSTTADLSPQNALYVMRPDGSGVQRLSNRDLDKYGVAGDIAWQPLPVETTLGSTPDRSPASTISPSISDPIPIESSPGAVSGVAYGFGSLWVSSFDGSQKGRITRLDPKSGETIARIPTGDVFPTWEIGGGGLTAGDGSLWLAGAAAAPGEAGGVHAFLVRIDPETNAVVARIDLGTGSGADVAVDDSGVWALSFSVADDGTTDMLVTRVDASSNAVVATIPLDATYGHYIFAVQSSIVAQTNAVHQDTVAGTVLHIIDPATNTVETSVPLGTYAWPAADETRLWALDGRTILSIDPATGTVLDSWEIPNTGDAVAAGEGGVWFLDPAYRAAVSRFDPSTGQIDVSVRLGRDSTPIAMAVAPGSLWVLNYEGTVTRVGLS
jgi:dipeptidyl aminopeptidase/acylaminoacyl peptidase